MDKFLALLISGAVSGAVFSLIAAGLVLTYQTTRVFNFAYGAVAYTAAFTFYELTAGFHWHVFPAAVVAIVIVPPLLGAALNALVFRPLAGADDAAKIVATVGLLIAIPNIFQFLVETAVDDLHWSIPRGDNILFPAGLGPSPKKIWAPFGSVRIDSNQAIVFGTAVVCAVGLWYLVRHTKLGLRMRATVERPNLAEARGVDTASVSRVVWMLGFMLAGLAGVVGAPFFSLTPVAYTGILVIAATAAVFGGLRSVPLAFAGGILLGVATSFFSGYAHFAESIPGLASSVPYILLFVFLFFLGRARGRVAGSVADVPLPPAHLDDLPAWRRALPWTVGVVVLVGYTLFVANGYWLGLVTKGLAYSLIFLSFVVVTGIGGMVSLAQSSFVIVASLTTGLCLDRGLPWGLALVIGVLVAAGVGMVVSLPALRLGGLSLALATLALGIVADSVLFGWDWLSNGDAGWPISRPVAGFLDFNDERSVAMLLLILCGLVAAGIGNLQRSPSGRSMIAIRSAAPAAASVGLSAVRSKLRVFAVSAAIAGLGGIMLATVNRNISSLSLNAMTGLTWLAVVVLFGIRRPGGAFVAGLLFAFSPEITSHITSSSRIADILFGLGAIHLAKAPDGILTQVAGALHRRRTKRRPEPAIATREEVEHTPAEVLVGVAPSHRESERPDGPVALRLRGVSSGYGTVEVLHDVDLDIPAGAITVLLGANGAGKSTLCKTIAGEVANFAGSIELDGRDVTKLAPHDRAAAGLAIAPESRGIFPGLTVSENLALTLPSSDFDAALAPFSNLSQRRKLEAGYLSGGEQQMLTLAPVLVHPPAVLVADEPSLGLAPLIVSDIMRLFTELRERGTAVLIVEEKASHVLEVADHVVFLGLGRVLWNGPAAEVDFDRIAATYLSVEQPSVPATTGGTSD